MEEAVENFMDQNRLRLLKEGKIKFTEIGNINGKPLLIDSYVSRLAPNYKMFDFYYSSCILTTVYSSKDNFLDIDFFICDGGEKGDGKKMMCYAMAYLKERGGLNDATIVQLTAAAGVANTLKNKRVEKPDVRTLKERQAQLEAYYITNYGFQKSDPEDPRSQKLYSTLGAIVVKCYPPPASGSSRRKTRRRKTKKMSRKV